MRHLRWKFFLPLFFPAFFLFAQKAYSADAQFYTLNQRWEKANASGTTKKEAVEQSFAEAMIFKAQGYPELPLSPPLKSDLAALGRQQRVVQLALGQSLIAAADNDILKFIATTESIVVLETLGSRTLRVLATGIGRTFIHVWDSEKRSTFEVWVIAPVFVPSFQDVRQTEAFEKSRPFRLTYESNRGAFYTGPKSSDLKRDSLDFNQKLSLLGDTPYGTVISHGYVQRNIGKYQLTDIQAGLEDGRIGPFKNFNAYAGDSSIKPDFMVFSQGRIRGGLLNHWDDKKRVKWTSFYGREQTSIFGTLTPGLFQERTIDSFLSGGYLDFKMNENARIKSGYFSGYGRARPDDLNRHGAGVLGDFDFGPHIHLNPEIDFDNERFANRHALTLSFEKARIRGEFRNIEKRFVSLLGSPSQQGELGALIEVSAQPFSKVSFLGSLDVFRDRRIPNPDDLEANNVHTNLSVTWTPTNLSSLTLSYQDLDDTGRLSPTQQRTLGLQYNQLFNLWGRRASFFSRYQNRDNKNLTNSTLSYIDDQILVGFYTEIFWGIRFSMQYEWNSLEENESGRITHPAVTTYSLDYSKQIGNSPFYVEMRLRMQDEEETESINSFKRGEDTTEFSGGIYYREYEDFEVFLTGRFENFVPEKVDLTETHVEAQFFAGVKATFDTHARWNAVGSFKGHVFKDLNTDGIKQPEEPGIKGMTVTTSEEKKAQTGDNGFYDLGSVSGRKAVLSLDVSNLPYGYVPTNATRREFMIEHSKTVQVDFGLAPRSEVRGLVFNDLNGNGRYDLTDVGIEKVKITLENGALARTNLQGVFMFTEVVAGDHTVFLDVNSIPEGYLPLDAPRKKITVFEGIRYELNFILKAERVVAGKVFLDQNKNGRMDQNEEALSGVRVLLGDKNVLTDEEGYYLFDNLNAGSYPLSVDKRTLVEPVSVDLPLSPKKVLGLNIPVAAEITEQ